MDKESPLDLLMAQIREAEAERRAVEEELNQTPGWRFRERSRLKRRFKRRLAAERKTLAFAEEVSVEVQRSSDRRKQVGSRWPPFRPGR